MVFLNAYFDASLDWNGSNRVVVQGMLAKPTYSQTQRNAGKTCLGLMVMNVNERTRQRIKFVIKSKDLAARRWSEQAGLGPNHLQQFLDGDKTRSIKIGSLEALAKVIGWSVEDLIGPQSRAIQPDLLATVLKVAIRTSHQPLTDLDNIAKVTAATYERALAYGLSPDDEDQIRFGVELLQRESDPPK